MAGITDIFSAVLEKTREGKVSWKPTSNENVFIANLGEGVATIERGTKGTFEFRLLTNEAADVGHIDSGTATGMRFRPNLEHLYHMARRSALGIDKTLEGMFNYLQKL